MNAVLNLPKGQWEDLINHLLPEKSEAEQAAFLFAKANRTPDKICLDVVETSKLSISDFDVQASDYLELHDASRARLIKRAHDLGASLIEMHSHPGPWPAAFSIADRMGLRETVPHMWWRLPKRPYLAIVVAQTGFDALLWIDNPKIPTALTSIIAGDQVLRPTNSSFGGWR